MLSQIHVAHFRFTVAMEMSNEFREFGFNVVESNFSNES